MRQSYLDFFAHKERDHLILPSAPLVPQNDPTLLWISAGMAPFKSYFDGRETPPHPRLVTCQKCIRTNDIENVGLTARHHTFFEMLGNFSLGDYFKREAIRWAYQYVTEVLDLEQDRIWSSVYHEDEEAYALWQEEVGLPKERIVHLGKKDNFWEIGTGPCGPCSELYYDRGESFGCDDPNCKPGCDCDRYLEIWNLVFTQFNRTEKGEYLPLPQKNIDTGLGLERVASILQGVDSNYDTDLVRPLIEYISKVSGVTYKRERETDQAFQVIADHLRGISFAIADGVLPSNEGRGYIIRRLLRRALRYGQHLGLEPPYLYKAHTLIMDIFGDSYKELVDKKEHVIQVMKREELRFKETLDQGLQILMNSIHRLKEEGEREIPGPEAFRLYDTYGFPWELTQEIAREEGLDVDAQGFNQEMERQRRRAREALSHQEVEFGGDAIYKRVRSSYGETTFIGYRDLFSESRVIGLVTEKGLVEELNEGEEGEVLVHETPFYPEGGGQVGDTGTISTKTALIHVSNTRKRAGIIGHKVTVERGSLATEEMVTLEVDAKRRRATALHHTATHILHQALRDLLGTHVEQAGSMVSPLRLRFDFSHYQSLSRQEIRELEKRVNGIILKNLLVKPLEVSFQEAQERGALALFDEKYGDRVRALEIGNYSFELCGGTHVERTGDLGLFKIISEGSTAAGIRRIEALCGEVALDSIDAKEDLLLELGSLLQAQEDDLPSKVEALLKEEKRLKREIASMKDTIALSQLEDLLEGIEEVNGISILTGEFKDMEAGSLRNMSDTLKKRMGSGIIVLASNLGGKVLFVASVTSDLVERGYHAGNLVKKVARITGGGGGGRPHLAQAGGKNPEMIGEALQQVKDILNEK